MPSSVDMAAPREAPAESPGDQEAAETLPPEEALAEAAGARIDNPRAIVNRRRLTARLAEIFAEIPAGPKQRAAVLTLLKEALAAGRAEVRRRFEEEAASGTMTVRSESYLVDQIIRVVYDHATQRLYPIANPSTGERLSLVAVGGYGRGELAPQSDIDLLFLLPYKLTPRSEQVVEEILYLLWDMGFKVGHSTRSVNECIRLAKGDITICTALLEARWLWGDQALYREMRQRFHKDVQAGGGAKFIESKLSERKARHDRFGGSRYALEPNIKEGKGGLRDLHTLFWMAKFLYNVDDISTLVQRKVFTASEVQRFDKALNFLWSLRCHMHYISGRADERLTFDMQKEIAPRMGFTSHGGLMDVERFMKRYFLIAKEVGDLTRIFCAVIEAEHNRRSRFRLPVLRRRRKIEGFGLEGDRLTVSDPEVFSEDPVEMLRIFQVAQKHELDIHPETLRAITRKLKHVNKELRADPKANAIFLDMLTSEKDPETTLRRLNEAGVFGRFLPDFGRVVAQMQYNMYHSYTVDEHTIFAIGILHAIEQGGLAEAAPIATEVVHKVLSRRVLYMAVLLHDIAKGRGGDHSELGAKVAEKVCPRIGLDEAETETVSWLVLHHLAMSDTAFKRDIDDPKTIRDFADLVQSPERLRLLLVLTVADIRAVGPGVWNAWKAALLRDLYWRTESVLGGGLAAKGRDVRVKAAKEALKEKLKEAGWPGKDITAHLRRGYPSYWSGLDTDSHLRHARLVLLDDLGLRGAIAAFWLRQLGYEVAVARYDPALGALPPGDGATSLPAVEEVDAAAAWRAAQAGAARLVDVRASSAYRAGHAAGALWGIRPRLDRLPLDRAGTVHLVGDDAAVTALAAAELRGLGQAAVSAVSGGQDALSAAGAEVEASPESPSREEAIDFLWFVHDRHDGNLEASRAYLAWEQGLIAQLDAQERAALVLSDWPAA